MILVICENHVDILLNKIIFMLGFMNEISITMNSGHKCH
jgi:hypothetical protein